MELKACWRPSPFRPLQAWISHSLSVYVARLSSFEICSIQGHSVVSPHLETDARFMFNTFNLPLVWSWRLAGLSYWPEPSEEHWSTFRQLGSSSAHSGPQAFVYDHCCPPQTPGPYNHPSSTWRRVLSQTAGPEHQGEHWGCLYLQLGLMLFCPPTSHTVRDVFLSSSKLPTLKPMVGDVSISWKLKLWIKTEIASLLWERHQFRRSSPFLSTAGPAEWTFQPSPDPPLSPKHTSTHAQVGLLLIPASVHVVCVQTTFAK